MRSKEFAEKYAGVRVKGINNGLTGIVSGYYLHTNDVVLMENDSAANPGYHKNISSKKSFTNWRFTREMPAFIEWWYAEIDSIQFMIPVPSNLPDDCDDCEAKGNEPCKDTCPNKEM